MNNEIVGRLSALLARVRARSAEPRRAFVASGVSPSHLPGDSPKATAVSAQRPAPEAEIGPATELLFDGSPHQATPAQADSEAAKTASVLDEPFLGDASDSRERLVAAEPLPEGDHAVPHVAAQAQASDSPPDALTTERHGVDDYPVVEQAPVSSRRPVAAEAEERLAELAFGAEEPEPARHTPPPESGQLPAAFERDITGVRDSSPISPRRSEQAAFADLGGQPSFDEAPGEAAHAPELVAQVTRPLIVASDRVADVLGQVQRFAPTTFLALLDASMKL